MENYEYNENLGGNVNAGASVSDDTQPVDISSHSDSSYQDGYEMHTEYQQPQTAYTTQQPIYSTQQAAQYTDPYNRAYMNQPQYVPYGQGYNNPPQGKTKGSAGKKVALIAGALAIALCVGVGGGFLGASLAGNRNGNVAETSASSQTESASSENSDSALQIIQASNTETTPTTIQEVALKVKDSVVEITTEETNYDMFYGQYVSQAAGSGVIISQDGYILTNNHVIDGANTITVRLTNGKSYTAKLIGKDATLDVALIKIEESDLTVATFGDSSKLNVGQTAIAIGNPLGSLGGTVTDGIISALDREITVDGKQMNLLQTNAAINPGNSGGGLFDANGNLIGIVVAKSSSTSSGTSIEGLGFAIPVNDIIDILSDLKTKGYVSSRAYLGVNLVDITTENAMFMYRVDKAGVYVSSVTKGSAAEKAGIQIGDCIVKVDDTEIDSTTSLKAIISKHKAGDQVKITVYRDGSEKELDVTLGESVNDSTVNENSEENRKTNPYNQYDDYEDFFRNW